jgi:GNAT superfamily N-acetyltransferase
MSVRVLPRGEAPAAVRILCEAFHDYPVMRWVLASVGADYDRRLARMVGFFVAARAFRGESLLGIDHGESLGAVAMLSDPNGPPSPPELGVEREAVWSDLGHEARLRYEAFGEACAPLLVTEPHIHLNMIGTLREARGQGYGRILLEYVHAMSERDPTSRGVSLTTENPENVPLYKAFGYEITGHTRVSSEVETWAFYRPNEAHRERREMS